MSDYTIRDLKASDIFPVICIINKIGYKDIKDLLTPEKMQSMVKLFNSGETAEGETKETVNPTTILGANLIVEVTGILFEHLPSIEQDLYKFLGSLIDRKPKEVAEMPLADFGKLIVDVLKKPDFADFIKAVFKLMD